MAVSSVAVAVSAMAWLCSIACALVGLTWQVHRRAQLGASAGTVLAVRATSENTQDLVLALAGRRGRRPEAVIRMKLRRFPLTEGQQVRVAVRPDGRVRLGLKPASMSLSRPTLAYIGAAQLAVIGVLALVIRV
jgi:hypothetical protein